MRLDGHHILAALVTSPWSFRLTCVYVFFEYVRPQSLYPALAFAPWSLISILAALLALVIEGRSTKWPTLPKAALAFFSVVVVLSSLLAYSPTDALDPLRAYGNWILAMILIAGTVNTERRWLIFLLFFLLWNFKMSQHGFRSWVSRGLTFSSWGVTGGPGWFQNSGEFALQMGIMAPLALRLLLSLRQSLSPFKKTILVFLPVSAVTSVVASSSRGGLLALVGIGLYAVIRSRYRIRSFLALGIFSAAVWFLVPQQMKNRFSSAGSDTTSLTRLEYWKNGLEMVKTYPVLGVGHGSWVSYYRDHYFTESDPLVRYTERGDVKIEVAHNSFVEVASQLGLLGLSGFLAIIGSIFWVNNRTRRLLARTGERGAFLRASALALDEGAIAFCIAGFFMSVAFYPFVWFQLAMTIGVHAAASSLLCDGSASCSVAHVSTNRLIGPGQGRRQPSRTRRKLQPLPQPSQAWRASDPDLSDGRA